MMLICEKCSHVIDEEDLEVYIDNGQRVVDFDCQQCNGEYIEAVQCLNCEDWFSELTNWCCEKCLNEILQIDVMLAYIQSNEELQKEFFVNAWTYSKCDTVSVELIEICIADWNKAYSFYITKQIAIDRLQEFVKDDIEDFLNYYKNRSDE